MMTTSTTETNNRHNNTCNNDDDDDDDDTVQHDVVFYTRRLGISLSTDNAGCVVVTNVTNVTNEYYEYHDQNNQSNSNTIYPGDVIISIRNIQLWNNMIMDDVDAIMKSSTKRPLIIKVSRRSKRSNSNSNININSDSHRDSDMKRNIAELYHHNHDHCVLTKLYSEIGNMPEADHPLPRQQEQYTRQHHQFTQQQHHMYNMQQHKAQQQIVGVLDTAARPLKQHQHQQQQQQQQQQQNQYTHTQPRMYNTDHQQQSQQVQQYQITNALKQQLRQARKTTQTLLLEQQQQQQQQQEAKEQEQPQQEQQQWLQWLQGQREQHREKHDAVPTIMESTSTLPSSLFDYYPRDPPTTTTMANWNSNVNTNLDTRSSIFRYQHQQEDQQSPNTITNSVTTTNILKYQQQQEQEQQSLLFNYPTNNKLIIPDCCGRSSNNSGDEISRTKFAVEGITMKNDDDKNNSQHQRQKEATKTVTCSSYHPPPPPASSTANYNIQAVYQMCKDNQWMSVLDIIKNNPLLSTKKIIMKNKISSTILHQAIISKGDDIYIRTEVIEEILSSCYKSEAARMKNGYGSLPLHVIAQRSVRFDCGTKEMLIKKIMNAYPEAVNQKGGVNKRTPFHSIFADFISVKLVKDMIQHGKEACFMVDKNGFLPAHVACSRHCSPEKLDILLEANPNAIDAITYNNNSSTNGGDTLLSLAQSTATKKHPNNLLIQHIITKSTQQQQKQRSLMTSD